jgi:predicted esterase
VCAFGKTKKYYNTLTHKLIIKIMLMSTHNHCDDHCYHILCLHGRRQTGNIFEKRLDTTIRRLRTQTETTFPQIKYYFLDAPFPTKEDEHTLQWWRPHNNKNKNNKQTYAQDLQQSLSLLEETLNKHGPFHCILSFSQGCALVAEGKYTLSNTKRGADIY